MSISATALTLASSLVMLCNVKRCWNEGQRAGHLDDVVKLQLDSAKEKKHERCPWMGWLNSQP